MEVIFMKKANEECGCGSKDVWWTILYELPHNEPIHFCNDCAEELRKQLNI